MPADSLQKQENPDHRPSDTRFSKGRSGNPSGRQPGCRNRSTLAAESLLEGEADLLTRKAIDLALAGDTTALRLCLERLVPQRRSRSITIEMRPVESVGDVARAIGAVFQEVSRGNLRLDEGAALVGMLESKRRAIETIDLEQRLRALEAQGSGETAV